MTILTKQMVPELLMLGEPPGYAALWRIHDAIRNGRLPKESDIEHLGKMLDVIQRSRKGGVNLKKELGLSFPQRGRQRGPTMDDINSRTENAMRVLAHRATGLSVAAAIEQVAKDTGISFATVRRHYDAYRTDALAFLGLLHKPTRLRWLEELRNVTR